MSKRIDLTGQHLGRWTVIEYVGNTRTVAWWKCRCDCGTVRIVNGRRLRDGTSKSCGCLRRELMSKHGASNTRLYGIWTNMKGRCNNPNAEGYKDYGGRGIQVCKEWAHDFSVFQEWAMSHGYQETLSIDRVDVDGNYCPENCRWASMKEQQNNKRTNVFCEIDGETMTLAQWAEYANLPKYEIYDRWRRGKRGHDLIRPLAG